MCLAESVRSYYNLILKKAGQFLTDLQVNLLKFALALRSYSPAVHASQQVCCDPNNMTQTVTKPCQRQPGYITRETDPLLFGGGYIVFLPICLGYSFFFLSIALA